MTHHSKMAGVQNAQLRVERKLHHRHKKTFVSTAKLFLLGKMTQWLFANAAKISFASVAPT
jgi:hypothetical protein